LLLEAIVLAAAAFASSNIDDAFLLLAFFSNPHLKASHVIVGQYVGSAALVLTALVFAFFALAVPSRFLGLLGFLPIMIGLRRLWLTWRSPDSTGAGTRAGSARSVLSVASVTIANGGDNIAVYVPLLAGHLARDIAITCGTFAVMTGLWCGAALLLLAHPVLQAPIRRWGHHLVPFVLMAIGVYILHKAGGLGF
jgi:cadmium resistance protein CadD (predicted permease)